MSRLIKTTVETIRTKLDRLYLEALAEAERSGHAATASEDEVKALQEEVDSLYSEILPVAQMSVEQQHLEPALKSISSRSGQGIHRSAIAVSYVSLLERISLRRCLLTFLRLMTVLTTCWTGVNNSETA